MQTQKPTVDVLGHGVRVVVVGFVGFVTYEILLQTLQENDSQRRQDQDFQVLGDQARIQDVLFDCRQVRLPETVMTNQQMYVMIAQAWLIASIYKGEGKASKFMALMALAVSFAALVS